MSCNSGHGVPKGHAGIAAGRKRGRVCYKGASGDVCGTSEQARTHVLQADRRERLCCLSDASGDACLRANRRGRLLANGLKQAGTLVLQLGGAFLAQDFELGVDEVLVG